MDYYSEEDKVSTFNIIWLILTVILILYSFFFQYAVKSFGGLMILLCGGIIVFGTLQVFVIQRGRIEKSLLGPIVLFVFAAGIITIAISGQGEYGSDLIIRMIEYVMTAYSIYLLLSTNRRYTDIVFWCICLTITCLGLVSLFRGVVITSAGAKGIEGLNANSMSNYFIIMTFCSFYLIWKKRRPFQNFLLVVMNVIVMIAQISAASRRGFIVLILFYILSLIFALIPYKSENSSKRKSFRYMFLIVAMGIALVFFQKYLLDNTVLGARLLGSFDGGDAARTRYQEFAWEQFLKHPVFGIGLGGIAYHMGAYSHSMYYELLSCTGLVLTLVFLIGFLRFGTKYLKMNRLYRKIGTEKNIIYITAEALIFLLCLLISGYAVVMIYDFHFYISVALLAAVYKNIEVNSGHNYLVE